MSCNESISLSLCFCMCWSSVFNSNCIIQMLSSLFERCMKRRGVKETDPYDWEKLESGIHLVNQSIASQNNMPSNIQSHIQVKTDQIHGGACVNSTGVIGVIATGNATTIGATNASGIEYVSRICCVCVGTLYSKHQYHHFNGNFHHHQTAYHLMHT